MRPLTLLVLGLAFSIPGLGLANEQPEPVRLPGVRGNIVLWQEPGVTVPAGLEQAAVAKAIRLALVMRAWRITEHNTQAQYLDVELPVREHVARLRITYGSDQVRLEYREGENLPKGWVVPAESPMLGVEHGYKFVTSTTSADGRRAVHRNYHEWIQELARTIEGALTL
jgi:hypothetical protein